MLPLMSYIKSGDLYISSEKSKLDRSFFARPAEDVAKDLLGRIIVRERPSRATLYGRIQNVAAWEGKKGMVKDSLGAPGALMVFTSFGKRMFGIATNDIGLYSCVTFLGAPVGDKAGLREYADGPSKLAVALEIDTKLNGVPIDFGPVWIGGEAVDSKIIRKSNPSTMPENCRGTFYFR